MIEHKLLARSKEIFLAVNSTLSIIHLHEAVVRADCEATLATRYVGKRNLINTNDFNQKCQPAYRQ